MAQLRVTVEQDRYQFVVSGFQHRISIDVEDPDRGAEL
jgi:hypothetical protein